MTIWISARNLKALANDRQKSAIHETESGDSGLRSLVRLGFSLTQQAVRGMRCGVQPLRMLTTACQAQVLSRRDFLFPDADEKYVPAVLAYIHDTDVETLNTLLYTQTPEEVVATFPYLSDFEKKFACRALFDQWAERLAAGGRPMLRTSWSG